RASLTLGRSTVAGNGGSGVWCSGTTSIDSCTVSENGSGGVYGTGSLALVNSTIAMNSGPGLFLVRAGLGTLSVSVVCCPIARNAVYTTATVGTSSRGGGIDVHPFSRITGSAIQLRNTIVAGNVVQQVQYTSTGMALVGAPVPRDLNTQSWSTPTGTMSTQ